MLMITVTTETIAGVFVSCKEKNALASKGISETAKIPKQKGN